MKKLLLVLVCLAALSVLPACKHLGCGGKEKAAQAK